MTCDCLRCTLEKNLNPCLMCGNQSWIVANVFISPFEDCDDYNFLAVCQECGSTFNINSNILPFKQNIEFEMLEQLNDEVVQ